MAAIKTLLPKGSGLRQLRTASGKRCAVFHATNLLNTEASGWRSVPVSEAELLGCAFFCLLFFAPGGDPQAKKSESPARRNQGHQQNSINSQGTCTARSSRLKSCPYRGHGPLLQQEFETVGAVQDRDRAVALYEGSPAQPQGLRPLTWPLPARSDPPRHHPAPWPC